MGTPDTAGAKATETAQKARETGGKAGETAQKAGETIGAAVRGSKSAAQDKADGIASDAQKAWKAQQGDSAWQKVRGCACFEPAGPAWLSHVGWSCLQVRFHYLGK